MRPFRTILFPVDFSEAIVALAPSVRASARRFDASVIVLHAFNIVTDYDLAPHPAQSRENERSSIIYTPALQQLRDQRQQRLEEFAHVQFPGTRHSGRIEDGDPASVIEWVAQREDTDLIMMPTKGLGRFRRLLVGSVTAKVLHDVDCPVLTSAHVSEPVPTPIRDYRSIVCAVEMNEEADHVMVVAAWLAQQYDAELCLVHMESGSTSQSGGRTSEELVLQAYEKALCADGGEGGIRPNIRVLDLPLSEGIRRTAIDQKADLVVLGRGGGRAPLAGMRSHLFTIVRESPCQVLSL